MSIWFHLDFASPFRVRSFLLTRLSVLLSSCRVCVHPLLVPLLSCASPRRSTPRLGAEHLLSAAWICAGLIAALLDRAEYICVEIFPPAGLLTAGFLLDRVNQTDPGSFSSFHLLKLYLMLSTILSSTSNTGNPLQGRRRQEYTLLPSPSRNNIAFFMEFA